jgi:hypothetical protein
LLAEKRMMITFPRQHEIQVSARAAIASPDAFHSGEDIALGPGKVDLLALHGETGSVR